jgi:hypothetical protein
MIQVPDFIEEAIAGGINVTIMRHAIHGIAFDMNLEAKSHMHLIQEDDGQWYALMRYDEKHLVEDIDDLKRLAIHGKHGREYINYAWAEFLMTREEKASIKLGRDTLAKLSPAEIEAIKAVL